jgi:hypothetical protein
MQFVRCKISLYMYMLRMYKCKIMVLLQKQWIWFSKIWYWVSRLKRLTVILVCVFHIFTYQSVHKLKRKYMHFLINILFYCSTVHLDNIKVLLTNKCTIYYPYKMLKFTVKTSVYLFLHVSVHMDHLQGVHVGPC